MEIILCQRNMLLQEAISYKIDKILSNGDLILKDARYQGGIEEDV